MFFAIAMLGVSSENEYRGKVTHQGFGHGVFPVGLPDFEVNAEKPFSEGSYLVVGRARWGVNKNGKSYMKVTGKVYPLSLADGEKRWPELLKAVGA